MRVRVYDKQTDKYFISEVYAIINSGFYEKYLVLEKINNDRRFSIIEYLDKTNDGPIYPVNINLISSNELPEHWVSIAEHDLKEINDRLDAGDRNNSLYSYRGFAFILEQKDLFISLLKGIKVSYESIRGNKNEICTKLKEWNYIESEENIRNLMQEFKGFHDSVLRNLNYNSGSGKGQEGMLVSDHIRQVTMVFDSEWSDSIEIVFEGVLALNLRPAKDNYCSDLFSATVMIKNETILFYDDTVDSEQENYQGTWVNALGMRWRYCKTK